MKPEVVAYLAITGFWVGVYTLFTWPVVWGYIGIGALILFISCLVGLGAYEMAGGKFDSTETETD